MRSRTVLFAALGLMTSALDASGDPPDRESPPTVLMSFTYGHGLDQVDTTCVDPGDPFRTVVQSFRVEPDETVWLLAGRGGEQTLRHFHSVGGLAREFDLIPLPGNRETFADFLLVPGGVILSRCIGSAKDLAAFSRLERGKGIVEEVSLPHEAGFNRYRGQRIANIGKLRIVADTLYDCFDRYGSCIRIGAERLFHELSAKDVLSGSPTITGGPVWCDRLHVFNGITPVVDLTGGGPAMIEEVFEDGSFVIRRTTGEGEGRRGLLDLYEMYSADGRHLRSVMIPTPDPNGFGVGDGQDLCFSFPWVYRLAFWRFGVDLERY